MKKTKKSAIPGFRLVYNSTCGDAVEVSAKERRKVQKQVIADLLKQPEKERYYQFSYCGDTFIVAFWQVEKGEAPQIEIYECKVLRNKVYWKR